MAEDRVFVKAAALAALLTVCISPVAAASKPTDVLRTTMDAVIAVLQQDIPKESKRAKVSALVRERFDFRTMSQGVLATNWKKTNEDEKRRFIELFTELLETTYQDRIDAYNNERVEYVDEKIKGRRAVVDTLVVTADVEIPVQYKLLDKGGDWKTYDVVIEGVSLIRNYRDSYREIVKKEGIEGLLAKMELKIEEIRNSPEKGAEP